MDVSNIWIYVTNGVVQLSDLRGKKFDVRHYTQIFQADVFILSHAYRHHWPLLFYTIVSDLDFGFWSEGQWKANHVRLIFLLSFQLFQIKFNIIKQFKLNMLILCYNEICVIEGETKLFHLLCLKRKYIGMRSDVYDLMFKLGWWKY